MKNSYKVLSIFIIALGLFVGTIFTVKADENYTITIDGSGKNHTFKAYQVFSGLLYTNDEGKDVLSNIQWGDDVEGEKILTAITTDSSTLIDKMNSDGVHQEQLHQCLKYLLIVLLLVMLQKFLNYTKIILI